MGKEKRRSTSKQKRSSRLSVLDRIDELTSKESELRDASDVDVRRRESIAEFQLANIETISKETRAYWVIGKQIEINKEIEEKFRVVDKESIKLNEKLLQFMSQLKDKRKATNAMKTHLLEAQCQNLEIFESKLRINLQNANEFSEEQIVDHLSSVAADSQVEEAITAGIFRHLKPRIAEAKKNNRRVYEDKMKSIRQLFTRPKRDLKEIHSQLLLVQNEKLDLEAKIAAKEAALEKQKRQTRQLAQRLKILDENNAIMNVMNKEKISITSKADWLLKKCLLELALLKQNFDNRDQKFISRTNMNSKLQVAMSCVENLKTLVSPTPRKNNQEGTQKAIDQLRSKSKTEITSTSVTKMSFSKIEEQYAPKRKFRKRELLSESNNRIKDMRPTSVAETVIIKKNVRSRIPKTVKRGRFVSLPQELPDNRIDAKRKILNRMRLKTMSE